MGPTDEAAFIVTKLRQLGDKFNRLAEAGGDSLGSIREGGRLVIRASDLGYLSGIDGLPELVKWAKSPEPPLGNRQAQLKPCPENVFIRLAGFDTVIVERTADGLKIVRGSGGGLLPDAMPETLPALPPSQYMTEQKQAAHYATVCDWLANRIDETRTRPPENAITGGPPAGYVLLSAVLDKVDGKYAKAKRILDENKNKIGTWKPTPRARRLYVNAAAWLAHFTVERQPDDAAIERFLDGAEQRKANIVKRPGRKGKTLPQK